MEQAILVALQTFRDRVESGWLMRQEEGGTAHAVPWQVWIDAGYMTDVVYTFCRSYGGMRYLPAVGRGASQQANRSYRTPVRTGPGVKEVGEGYYLSRLPAARISLMEVDADHWKSWVHQRLAAPGDRPGSLQLFHASPQEHLALAKHLTSEARYEEFTPGKGMLTKWKRVRRQNHWLDALYNAAAAAHYCGVRLHQEDEPRRVVYAPPEASIFDCTR